MLETMVGVLSLLSTWRFCVVLLGAVVGYFVLMDAVPVGILRIMGFACSVVVGAWLGSIWQRRHERLAGCAGCSRLTRALDPKETS
jgi:hypothetical protein